MRILLDIPGTGRQLMRPAQQILQTMAEAWAEELRRRPLPPLYETGVHFKPEPWAGLGTEEWASPYTVFERNWGDCDDLSLFRCAQLLAHDVPANIVETWLSGTKRHHFLIRRGPGEFKPAAVAAQLSQVDRGLPFEDPSRVIVALGRRLK